MRETPPYRVAPDHTKTPPLGPKLAYFLGCMIAHAFWNTIPPGPCPTGVKLEGNTSHHPQEGSAMGLWPHKGTSKPRSQEGAAQEQPRSSPKQPGAARSRPGAAQEQPGAAQAQPGAAQEQPRRSPEATFDVFLAGRGGPKSEEASFGINFHQKSGPAIHRDLLKKCFFEQFLRHSGPPPRRLPSTCFWPEGGAQK